MKYKKDKEDSERKGKKQCCFILLLCFATIFIFNYVTPLISDDYNYAHLVDQAQNAGDLFRQEYQQYMTWTGRSVAHIILRFSFFLPEIIFKTANSLVFTLLAFLIMWNVKGRRRWSPVFLTMAVLGLWLGTVHPEQTLFWQTGACNYLWGTTIILTFMTVSRTIAEHFPGGPSKRRALPLFLSCLGMAVFGLVAGWCNENTSGGCLLFLIFLMAVCLLRTKKIPAPLIFGAVGNVIGLLFMVLAPGNRVRASYQTENYSGIMLYASRFQKISLTIWDEFPILIVLFLLTVVITVFQYRGAEKKAVWARLRGRLVFAVLFVLTSYALILTSEPQSRAMFGAGIFLIIAVLQGMRDNVADERAAEAVSGRQAPLSIGGAAVRAGYTFALAGLLAYFFFVYLDTGAMNIRIYRDIRERSEYIEEQKALGNDDIVVARLHPDFNNRYTEAYDSELSEQPYYWTNVGYENYYGVKRITAIDYDEWASKYKTE